MGFVPQPATMAVRNLLFCLVRHRFFSDRASGRFAPLQYHSLRGLPPYCQFIFKTLTGFTRLDRLGFHAAPLPSAPSPIVLSGELATYGCPDRGVLAVLSWGARCHRAWALTGRLHPASLAPRTDKNSGCVPSCIRGYCPFRCQFQHTCTAKTFRETTCSCVPHAPGTVAQDVVEIGSEPEPLPRDFGGYDWSIIPA